MIKTLYQFYRFFFIGIIVVSIDALFYFLFIFLDIFDAEVSKRISFIIGACFAFVLNKNFVFFSNNLKIKEPILFSLLYLSTFIINSFVHDTTLYYANTKLLAFLFATITSTCINFIGQKFIVFRNND